MATFEWTDELREKVIKDYTGAEPTPETSTEIVKDIADEIGVTPNAVRAILSRAEVYVKKDPAKKAASGNGTKRVSKAEEIQRLKNLVSSTGQDVSDEIIDKMTGKAAKYFADIFTSISVGE